MPGLHAQSLTLKGAEAAIRDVIALMREVPADSLDVTVSLVAGAPPAKGS